MAGDKSGSKNAMLAVGAVAAAGLLWMFTQKAHADGDCPAGYHWDPVANTCLPDVVAPLPTPTTYSAVVRVSGSNYVAESGETGQVIINSVEASTTIQAAIDYVGAKGGGIILIKSGLYPLNTTVNIVYNAIELWGEGDSTILKRSSTTPTPIKAGTGVYKGGPVGTLDSIEIHNIQIDCNGSATADTYGLWFHTVSNFKVDGCHIWNQGTAGTRGAAIATDYCYSGSIVGNHVHDTINGIAVRIGSKDVVIHGNHSHHTHNYDCITTYQSDGGHTISNNTCHHAADNGILLDGGPLGRNPNTSVTGNIIHDCFHEGLEVWASDNATVTGNTSYNNLRDGIRISSTGNNPYTIASNVSYNNANSGFRIFESRYGSIIGNISRANVDHGFLFDLNAHHASMTGNTTLMNGKSGIHIFRTSWLTISSNNLTDDCQLAHNTYDEIFITDNGTSFSTDNKISNNTIRSKLANRMRYGVAENAPGDNRNIITDNHIVGYVIAPVRILGANSAGTPNYTSTPTISLEPYDNFSEGTYVLPPLTLSPNSKWYGIFSGTSAIPGEMGVGASSDGSPGNVFYEINPTPASPAESFNSLTLTTESWKNFVMSVDMRTVSQTRGAGANIGDNAAIYFHCPGVDTTQFFASSFYKFELKADGFELSKRDGGGSVLPPDVKTVVASGVYPPPLSFALGRWYTVEISVTDLVNITIKVDGVTLVSQADLAGFNTGRFGLFSKNCIAEFKNLEALHI